MQQDNNNMDKKLKQLENQSLPDLSKMDEHWQSLKGSLHSTDPLPKSKSNRKIYRWIVAGSLAAIAFFITYQLVFKKKDQSIVTNTLNPISKPATDTNPILKFEPGKETFTIIDKDTVKLIPHRQKANQTMILTGITTDGKPVKLYATHVNGKKPDTTLATTKQTKRKAGPVSIKPQDEKNTH